MPLDERTSHLPHSPVVSDRSARAACVGGDGRRLSRGRAIAAPGAERACPGQPRPGYGRRPRPARASMSPTRPGRDVVVIDPSSGAVVGRIEVGKRPRGLKLTRDGKQLDDRAVGIADWRPRRRRVEAAAGRPCRGRHRCRRHRAAGSRRRNTTADRIPSPSTSPPDGKFLYVSNEDAAEMSCAGPGQRRGHAARQGRRRARGCHRAAGRPRRLRELRGRQRGRGDRHGDLQGRRADQDAGAAALDCVHARWQDRPSSPRERQRRQRRRREEAHGARDVQDSSDRGHADAAEADGHRPSRPTPARCSSRSAGRNQSA